MAATTSADPRDDPTRQLLNRATPYVFMAPAALVMVLALAYPLAQSIWLSFHQWAIGAPLDQARFIGLENYRILLADPNVWASIRVTLVFAFAVVVVIEVALGVALALVLDRKIRGMSLFRTIFILPMMVAPIVVGLVWRYLYNEQFGPLTTALRSLGLPTIPWLSSPDMALISVIIADVWQWTPFIFILSLAALQSLPASAIEAARIDGATRWQTILHVKLPLMLPVIIVAALLRLIDAFKVLRGDLHPHRRRAGSRDGDPVAHIYKTPSPRSSSAAPRRCRTSCS